MDPRKAAIVLLVLYGAILLWILPPFDEMRWRDEVAAQERPRVEAPARKGAAARGAGAARSAKEPKASRGKARPKGEPRGETQTKANRKSPAGKPGAVPTKPAADPPAAGSGGAPGDARGDAPGDAPGDEPGGKQKPAARSGKAAGSGPPAAAASVRCAELEIRAIGFDLPDADEQATVRATVTGGENAERMLSAWLQRLGAPATESEFFGDTGLPVEAGASLSLRVPPGLDLRVVCQAAGRTETRDLDPLRASGEREVVIDFAAGDMAVAPDGETLPIPLAVDLPGASEELEAPGASQDDPIDGSALPVSQPARAPGAESSVERPLADAVPGPVENPASAATEAEPEAPSGTNTPTGHWRLEVRDARRQEVVAGALVRLVPVSGDPSLLERLRQWATAEGRDPLATAILDRAGARTNEEGTLQVELPAGVAFELECAAADLARPDAALEVEPLVRDEQRRLTLDLVLPSGPLDPPVSGGPVGVAAGAAGAMALSAEEQGPGLPRSQVREASSALPPTTGEAQLAEQAEDVADPDAGAPSPAELVAPVESVGDSVGDSVDAPGAEPEPVAAAESAPPAARDEVTRARRGVRDEASLARLRGFVLDQDGHGIGGLSVWLVFPWGTADRHPRRLRFEDRLRAEARTAPDGSFAFLEVPDGRWMLGVAPAGTRRTPDPSDDYSRIARSVDLLPGEAPSDIILRIGRGLQISGRVEDIGGKPGGLLSLSVVEDGVTGSLWARTEPDGTFELGPLNPGPCSITVRVSDDAEQVFGPFEAGSSDVLVQLSATASVDGQVLDEVGQRVAACRLQVLRPYAQPPVSVLTSAIEGGTFELPDLQLGVYRIVAVTGDGRIAISRDLDLLSDERASGLELVLAKGAELTVQVRDAAGPSIVAVARGTRVFAVDVIGPGEVSSQTVPGGGLSISLLSSEGVVLDQLRLTGVPGESHDVVFDGK